eukprot:COSAG02_NODE_6474_length_3550_cov_10.176471_2_plen_346_part_00
MAFREDIGELTVPEWQVGCWRREIITFAEEVYGGNRFPLRDDTTFVVWLQTSSRCADIRLPDRHPGHPNAKRGAGRPPASLQDASSTELLLLAEADGWTGRCRAVGSQPVSMGAPAKALTAVNDWYEDEWSTGLPTDRKFPELGEMRRVGDCCLEFAPSGAYVEDWRLQPDSTGVAASLVLLSEDGRAPGAVVQYVCTGNHACFTRGRFEREIDMDSFDNRPLPEHLSASLQAGRRVEAEQLVNLECSYGVRDGSTAAPFIIRASTFPWQVGKVMPTVRLAFQLICFEPLRPVDQDFATPNHCMQYQDRLHSGLHNHLTNDNWGACNSLKGQSPTQPSPGRPHKV